MLFSLVAFEAYAVSFDCKKVRLRVEKTICSNRLLSYLDDLLASSYKKALANTRNKRSLRRAQRSWLYKRNRCRTNSCIKKTYRSRISELKKLAGNKSRSISGEYDRSSGPISADITILELKNGMVRVTGYAVWVGNGNVNNGKLNGSFPLKGNKVYYNKDGCRLTITFHHNALTISNDNSGCGGLNVTFDGKYRKVGS
jgi:uncharacterized protein